MTHPAKPVLEEGAYVKCLDRFLSLVELESSRCAEYLVRYTVTTMREQLGNPPLGMIETKIHLRSGALLISMTVRM